MPEKEIAQRGGYTRVRTQRLPGGRYRHIFVVRKAGPRGGHTVAGEVQESKTYAQPHVKMRARPVKLPTRKRTEK